MRPPTISPCQQPPTRHTRGFPLSHWKPFWPVSACLANADSSRYPSPSLHQFWICRLYVSSWATCACFHNVKSIHEARIWVPDGTHWLGMGSSDVRYQATEWILFFPKYIFIVLRWAQGFVLCSYEFTTINTNVTVLMIVVDPLRHSLHPSIWFHYK